MDLFSIGAICLNLIPRSLPEGSQHSETELELAEQPGEQSRGCSCLSASAPLVLSLGAGQRIPTPAVPAPNHGLPVRGGKPLPQVIGVWGGLLEPPACMLKKRSVHDAVTRSQAPLSTQG